MHICHEPDPSCSQTQHSSPLVQILSYPLSINNSQQVMREHLAILEGSVNMRSKLRSKLVALNLNLFLKSECKLKFMACWNKKMTYCLWFSHQGDQLLGDLLIGVRRLGKNNWYREIPDKIGRCDRYGRDCICICFDKFNGMSIWDSIFTFEVWHSWSYRCVQSINSHMSNMLDKMKGLLISCVNMLE